MKKEFIAAAFIAVIVSTALMAQETAPEAAAQAPVAQAPLVQPGVTPATPDQPSNQQPTAPATGNPADYIAPAAQTNVAHPPTAALPAPAVMEDKRVFGVLPNYRTADGTLPFTPLTAAGKFHIASKDTFDYPSYVLASVFAGLSQVNNSNPSFGQGMKGYLRRYGSSVADQDLGNMFTEAIMPSLLHQDPRYFRKVNGSTGSRLWYAVSRVFVAKNDSGKWTFNASEWLGNGMVASIGNSYYPDAVGFAPTMQRMFTQIGTDALSQVLKEFWPDIKRRWFTKHDNDIAAVTAGLTR
jgi:hypothetical protein